jgi:hypothetical protein
MPNILPGPKFGEQVRVTDTPILTHVEFSMLVELRRVGEDIL